MADQLCFRLHWTCESPSHYNDFLFKTINNTETIDLLVHYRNNSLSSHPWKTPLRVGYNSRVQDRTLGIDLYLLKKVIVENRSVFVFGGWVDATSILLIIICILLQRKYVFWTDTPNIHRKRRWIVTIARNTFLRIAFMRACAILGTGTPAMDALRKMGAAKDKLFNFPYWIDVDLYGPNFVKQDLQSDSFLRFVSSGRVVNLLKGHDLAIRSLAMAFHQIPDVNFEYLIAGTGPDSEKLMELADQLGIGEKVKILGWVEPGDLIKILHTSDVLIHPSPVHEPYGVAVIEAMAAGLIVFASDATCAALDRISHGVNGFIHNARNVDELSAQIIWLLKHPERMPAIKSEARKTAEQWRVGAGVEIIKRILNKCAA